MEEKKTNLAIAADVTTKKELLEIADLIGPEICILKTHIDIIADFDWDLIEQLQSLAKKHNFLLFEDRKFADIGSTVKYQFCGGLYNICKWADLITVHMLPGPDIIKVLQNAILPDHPVGLIVLAQMSSKETLACEGYTQQVVALSRTFPSIIGFICRKKVVEESKYIHFIPGIKINCYDDSMGQQYKMPDQAIIDGADIIIVGRGIVGAKDIKATAKQYRTMAWNAYQNKINAT
ncbi:orotidine-5'-phosphate decarboxylase [Candidatus Dependentiae bacterium]|nr:MAG: orotidine-5'-phosphate decarboxylase [Candidatus Dependentiae bacterium]